MCCFLVGAAGEPLLLPFPCPADAGHDGKNALHLPPAPALAPCHRAALHCNHRWALDGCDPASYAGVLWCFGERPGWLPPLVCCRLSLQVPCPSFWRAHDCWFCGGMPVTRMH